MIGTCAENKNEQQTQEISNTILYNKGVDSVKLLMQDKLIQQADSLEKIADKNLLELKKKTDKDKAGLRTQKEEADSALARFTRNPDLENCITTVKEQKEQIYEQETVIEDLGAEAEEYSNKNYALVQKVEGLETKIVILKSQHTTDSVTVVKLMNQNEKIQKQNKVGKFIRNTIITIETAFLIVKSL